MRKHRPMDFIENLNDDIDTNPADLCPLLADVLASLTAKKAIAARKMLWTTELETQLQEHVSALVAAAEARGLQTFDMIVTRPSGERFVWPVDVARVKKTRTLQ